jgi:nucleoside-triphosphatase THEP1
MDTKIINKIVIKPVISHDKDEKIKGGDLFPIKYPSINIVGMSGSGKSTVISNIIKALSDKKTNLILYSLTGEDDPIYRDLAKTYNLYIEDTYNKGDLIDLLKDFNEETLKSKKKEIICKNIVIVDDMPSLVNDPDFKNIIKMIRHKNSCLIIANHDCNEIQPQNKRMIKYALIFHGFNRATFKKYLREFNYNDDIDKLSDYYIEHVKSHEFIYISKMGKARHNFNVELS